jgi:predicted MFS family arabinose efflux permease
MNLAAAPASRALFITGLGIGQIVSWGTLYYSFPLIVEPMGRDLGYSRPALYGAATLGILVAALAAYPVGTLIDYGYGRAVMTWGAVLGAATLAGWSFTASLALFYLLFAGVGLAQAMTMYEPAFAVVTRRYGAEARRGITAITLWGGFASTVFIPITELAVQTLGWRGALQVLAAFNLVVCVVLYGWLIDPRHDAARPGAAPGVGGAPLAGARAVRWAAAQPAFWGLLVCFLLYYSLFTGLTFHWYPLLLERGFSAAAVVSALSIIGPAQVAGRIAMWVFANQRPVRSIGILALTGFPLALLILIVTPRHFLGIALFAAVCGAANGVITIVRGLVVPEMLTREAYGAINGALVMPANFARAFAPALVAALWAAAGGYDAVLLAGLAVSLLAMLAFGFAARRSPAAAPQRP